MGWELEGYVSLPSAMPVRLSCGVPSGPVSSWMDDYLRIYINAPVAGSRAKASAAFRERFPSGGEGTFLADRLALAAEVRAAFRAAGMVYLDRFVVWDGFNRSDASRALALNNAVRGLKALCAQTAEAQPEAQQFIGLVYCGTRDWADAIAAGAAEDRSLPAAASRAQKEAALSELSALLAPLRPSSWLPSRFDTRTPLPPLTATVDTPRQIFCDVWIIRDVAAFHRAANPGDSAVCAKMAAVLKAARRALDVFAEDIEDAGAASGVFEGQGRRVARAETEPSDRLETAYRRPPYSLRR